VKYVLNQLNITVGESAERNSSQYHLPELPQRNRLALLNPQRGSRKVGKFHRASIPQGRAPIAGSTLRSDRHGEYGQGQSSRLKVS